MALSCFPIFALRDTIRAIKTTGLAGDWSQSCAPVVSKAAELTRVSMAMLWTISKRIHLPLTALIEAAERTTDQAAEVF